MCLDHPRSATQSQLPNEAAIGYGFVMIDIAKTRNTLWCSGEKEKHVTTSEGGKFILLYILLQRKQFRSCEN